MRWTWNKHDGDYSLKLIKLTQYEAIWDSESTFSINFKLPAHE